MRVAVIGMKLAQIQTSEAASLVDENLAEAM